ncbi:MG2 domain-containing protein [Hymenobacter sp. J193]|uniref:MG2 domain-containing protein n=1 Tax=Hymenobacter sp. J193 TaxID=2898429 RepID=UPI0021511734|nr:MG2 domain-containing protein [Hymenobacter sp. J193]MCR5887851.1 MG2 domain-containing protein [Hymenobacter sp. J193]
MALLTTNPVSFFPRYAWRLALLLWLTSLPGYSQLDSLNGLTRKLVRYQQGALPEKLFLHLDRPLYLSGETMWFKVYAVEGTALRPLSLSKVAYVEVLDKEKRSVLQAKIGLRDAQGQGSFAIPASMPSGSYTVRAYTSWMKNFGPEYYFRSPITIVNTAASAGVFTRPDTARYDLQFFPEGGNLVQGLTSTVGFKATDNKGRGVAVEGKVLTAQGAVVAQFKSLRFGMGNFRFTPKAGVAYTAVVSLDKRPAVTYPLPRVYEQGYVLHVENSSATALTVTVNSGNAQPERVALLVHSRQQVAVAAQQQLVNGQAVFTIDPSRLLDGVSHLTVFNEAQQPVCERLYFQPPRQTLTITARPDKTAYAAREKASIQLTTGTSSGTLPANLSMAVYRLDSLTTALTPDINSYLWLSADLRGTVEQPAYYFSAATPEVAEATNNLMLTQGWSRFSWSQVLASTPPRFEHLPELNGLLVRGRLSKPGSQGPAGITTYLSSPSRIVRLQNAVSGPDGSFLFELNRFYGSRNIVVQTDPHQDSTSQVEIISPFSQQYSAADAALLPRLPRLEAAYSKRHFQNQVQQAFSGKFASQYTLPPADSVAFYGKPDERYLLDKYTRFKVLEEVMREYVPGVDVRRRKDGFHLLVKDKVNGGLLTQNPLVLLDGVPIFDMNKAMAIDPLSIQQLEVMDSRYFHGSSIYDGIVSFITYKGDLAKVSLDPRVLVQQYDGLQGQREFYAPRYDTPLARQSRLPDLRNLLYWNPAISTTAQGSSTTFYTGDQTGRYLVVVQGLTNNGVAGSTTYVLDVKQPL